MGTKSRAAVVSMMVNISLLITKIIVALLTGSIGLLAESAHSLLDLVASVLAYFGIKEAEKPGDDQHHFGHHKFENLSALLQALLLAGTGFIVMWGSYQKFMHPTQIQNSWVGIILMVITIPVAILTSRYLSRKAKESGGSQALEADSAHFTTDVLASIAVLLGLIGAHFGLIIADPIAALAVGIIMLYISIHIIVGAYKVFMDYGPDQKTMLEIKKIISADKRIKNHHSLKARLAGNNIFLEFHIMVNKNMTVKEAHEISHKIKDKLMQKIPEIKHCTIHIEPYSR